MQHKKDNPDSQTTPAELKKDNPNRQNNTSGIKKIPNMDRKNYTGET